MIWESVNGNLKILGLGFERRDLIEVLKGGKRVVQFITIIDSLID